ncbi:hypothetical protein C922_01874 [Plasmodium inui San Antonio 1]|uniref:Uncharacterized protein n=1 Tax=Plasmodium inui San Antonio 1 TaxID=1237626 RepID=W7A8S8_9APIC|nr:hypothetical protein C922_01874 [Plasmodium inui San Antonio 1]EUD67688.1 hypothetical protein C922_01874 [Plasmodium inui San Antonio 1]
MIIKTLKETKQLLRPKSLCIDIILHPPSKKHYSTNFRSPVWRCLRGPRSSDRGRPIHTRTELNSQNGSLPNVFEEELSNVFNEYPLSSTQRNRQIGDEEIIITDEERDELKRIGNVVKIDQSSYGVVLQINKHSVVLGRVKNVTLEGGKAKVEEYTTKLVSEQKAQTNVYTPFEYLNYLLAKEPTNQIINLFRDRVKETYHGRVAIKQLHTNLLLIDLFNKINYGQKICISGEKDTGRGEVIQSILYENLLTNLIHKNENFFIICSNGAKSETLGLFHDLHKWLTLACAGGAKSHLVGGLSSGLSDELGGGLSGEPADHFPDPLPPPHELYSKNYSLDGVKLPNDVLLICTPPQGGSKVATYISPLLPLYNLEEYKRKYKNVVLIFYDVTTYSEICSELQKEMAFFVRNYAKQIEEALGGRSSTSVPLIPAALPLSVQTILSKYMAVTKFPHCVEEATGEEDPSGAESIQSEYTNNACEESPARKSHSGRPKYVPNCKYGDAILQMEDKIGRNESRTSGSVTTFCFITKSEQSNPDINYTLSLSENNLHLLRNHFDIHPYFDLQQAIKKVTMDENKIWEIIKDEIREIYERRNELTALNENKKKYKIFIDHWEEEDLIHYNNIHFILTCANYYMSSFCSFQIVVFFQILIRYNFTNTTISRKSVHSFFLQFLHFYLSNEKYFSLLRDAYYQQLPSFCHVENARVFMRKMDVVLRCLRPPFRYVA